MGGRAGSLGAGPLDTKLTVVALTPPQAGRGLSHTPRPLSTVRVDDRPATGRDCPSSAWKLWLPSGVLSQTLLLPQTPRSTVEGSLLHGPRQAGNREAADGGPLSRGTCPASLCW